MLQALSPLDGRYAAQVGELRAFFSEEALIRARVEVELRYLLALLDFLGKKAPATPRLTAAQGKRIMGIIDDFSTTDAEDVKAREAETRHDVKAVEYHLRARLMRGGAGIKPALEFIHFGLTSEDVNNLAYGILVHRALAAVIRPALTGLGKDLEKLARAGDRLRLLSLTHGQPATPTTLGKEMRVFQARLDRQLAQLKAFRMQGKLGGATGGLSAHKAAYPGVRWEAFRDRFVKGLGLIPLQETTQINPHDDIAELSHLLSRVNAILLDLSQDVWLYISRGVFRLRLVKGEVGSSTMPHKVNPIDFENAEGNLGLSTALLSHFAGKLPVSRLQRDLSDSTVQRSLGVAFGYHLLAIKSLRRGLAKLRPDQARIRAELQAHPEVHAEAIQTILRKNGVAGAYESLKNLTRGRQVTLEDLRRFTERLSLPESEKLRIIEILSIS
ncbi:MAG: adenylosuccinate lyase [Candidatus Peregrinibacteria bacterium Greene0416_19]|nr:MAG: adenylosuccinate lyase [Candidatus Peregrinibacteria bacterium Greene0416_19]